jgi:orotate phosphoribosyltransferase
MNEIANALLETKSIHLQSDPHNYFTWTSGIKSPIYCDNRQLISYPDKRKIIVQKLVELIKDKDVDVIAATATAGISWGAWVANLLNLPLIYIRSKPKDHGLKNCIEGFYSKGQKAVVIEDLISTGKSSIHSIEELRNAGLSCDKVYGIFSYGFNIAEATFQKHNSTYSVLCTLEELLSFAHQKEYLSQAEVESIKRWKIQRDNS